MAPVVQLDIATETPFAQGECFGDVGAYRLLTGTANFAVDPSHSRNGAITDLDLAPRDLTGVVWLIGKVVGYAFQPPSYAATPDGYFWRSSSYR